TSVPGVRVAARVVQVDCLYRAGGSRDLRVSVRYALPIDINPWNDFYIGCTVTGHPEVVSTAAHAWDDHDRRSRVVGAKTWSLATFIDDLGALRKADVSRFEAMTKTIVGAAPPFSQDCKLPGNGGPVNVKSIGTFSVDAQPTSAGVTSSARSS